jgi:predicted TPR repeat methyltransferase
MIPVRPPSSIAPSQRCMVCLRADLPAVSSRPKLRRNKLGKLARAGASERTSASTSARARFADAFAKHQAGHFAEAADVYRAILVEQPDHVDALHFLGVALHQAGDTQGALESIGRAIALAPNHADALNNRGNICKRLGRLDEAEADYRQALRARPDDAKIISNLGTVRRARGDLEGAVSLFRQAIALSPEHAPAWQNLGNTLGDLDRVHEALDALREALRLAPQSADSYRYLGALLSTVGRVDDAVDVYRQWQAHFPNDPRARHFLAACTGEDLPARASDACVRREFDDFAPMFDATLARLDYQTPGHVSHELARLFPAAAPTLAILDAGCGTGLCGPRLRAYARTLHGVDLSPAMVELARGRDAYDDLFIDELGAYLRAHTQRYDLIVSADTLVYFGDLGDVLVSAAGALIPGGTLLFTVERADEVRAPGGFLLTPQGRYGHTRDHLLHTLDAAGLVAPTLREVNLRKEADAWVVGYLVSARKAGGQARFSWSE